jgi:hypothetical protein
MAFISVKRAGQRQQKRYRLESELNEEKVLKSVPTRARGSSRPVKTHLRTTIDEESMDHADNIGLKHRFDDGRCSYSGISGDFNILTDKIPM